MAAHCDSFVCDVPTFPRWQLLSVVYLLLRCVLIFFRLFSITYTISTPWRDVLAYAGSGSIRIFLPIDRIWRTDVLHRPTVSVYHTVLIYNHYSRGPRAYTLITIISYNIGQRLPNHGSRNFLDGSRTRGNDYAYFRIFVFFFMIYFIYLSCVYCHVLYFIKIQWYN